MAEAVLDLRSTPKEQAYATLHSHVLAVMHGIHDEIAGMSTIASLVHHSLGHLWTGFYRVVGDQQLRVGPYQGTLGCLDIRFGQGVCGKAAFERRTIIVPDVSCFPGHIACDARARSEIVVPVFNAAGTLIAVFDLDSARTHTFDEADQRGLEAIMTWFALLPLNG